MRVTIGRVVLGMVTRVAGLGSVRPSGHAWGGVDDMIAIAAYAARLTP
ncbi:MAG: hypothetical protein H7099_11450 [Gemmatimonadaceae bacterium]|nr:hypothetical protein [Gemmatimonadaceae bacterium]